MAQVIYKTYCACGNLAIITKSKDGTTTHKCFECLAKPPTLRQRDNMMLKQLGLIK